MIFDLIGIVEDGFPHSTALPANQRTTLQFPIGSDVLVRLHLYWARGEKIDLTGWTVTLVARKRPMFPPVFTKVAQLQAVQGRGRTDITIVPADTRPRAVPGRYVFQVTAVDATSKINIAIPVSPLVLEASL